LQLSNNNAFFNKCFVDDTILNTNSGLFQDCPAGGAVVNSLVTSQGDICSWLPRRLCLVWPQSIFNQHDSAEMSGGGRGLMKIGNNKSERKIIMKINLFYTVLQCLN